MAERIGLAGLPAGQREAKADVVPGWQGRRFRADFFWPHSATGQPLIVEVQGGGHNGRHARWGGYNADCEKLALATLGGCRVLYVTAEHIRNGQAVHWIAAALGAQEAADGGQVTERADGAAEAAEGQVAPRPKLSAQSRAPAGRAEWVAKRAAELEAELIGPAAAKLTAEREWKQGNGN